MTASMNLSVGSAGSDSVVTSTRVALPAGSSVHVVHVLLRLNFPPRPAATILYGALDLDERHVAPREAVERRIELEARAGAAAVRLDACQPPLLHVVVGELRVVGDVRQILEDLLARPADDDVRGDGVHRPRRIVLGGDAALHRVVALRGVHDLDPSRRLAPQRPAQLAHDPLAVQVDRLAQQRGAVAVLAAAAARRASARMLARTNDSSGGPKTFRTGIHRDSACRQRTFRCKTTANLGSRPQPLTPMLLSRRGRSDPGRKLS